MKFFMLHLRGGGGDIACAECLLDAQEDRGDNIVSIAPIDAAGESCGYCGIEAEVAA